MPASVAFVTDSNRRQPLWQPPPTACRTASGAASAVPSLPTHPCPGPAAVPPRGSPRVQSATSALPASTHTGPLPPSTAPPPRSRYTARFSQRQPLSPSPPPEHAPAAPSRVSPAAVPTAGSRWACVRLSPPRSSWHVASKQHPRLFRQRQPAGPAGGAGERATCTGGGAGGD